MVVQSVDTRTGLAVWGAGGPGAEQDVSVTCVLGSRIACDGTIAGAPCS